MSRDLVICWHGQAPAKHEVQRVLENFFAGVQADPVQWRQDRNRWFIHLPGKPSPALRGLAACAACRDDERWIEVWPGPTYLDVITRQQDEFTNALAEGLARLLARWFKGRIVD
jgi:hypothetical protein